MSEPVSEFTIALDQVNDYEFRVRFGKDGLAPLTVDEGPPLGRSAGPSPDQLLAAAIGGCLNASLLFCTRKARVDVKRLSGTVTMKTIRNEQGRLRIGKVDVEITPDIAEADRDRAARCFQLFENFCTVSQSIRDGIPIDVRVTGSE